MQAGLHFLFSLIPYFAKINEINESLFYIHFVSHSIGLVNSGNKNMVKQSRAPLVHLE